jgi:hypothetical protein
MAMKVDQVHQQEFETLQQKVEIAEIQKAISDSHLAIFDEKLQAMNLKRDYDLLQL